MRRLNYEQASRVGLAYAVGQFLGDFGALGYAGARADEGEVEDLVHQGWTLKWRTDPTPRIQISNFQEPKFRAAVINVLAALGLEIRDKGDHIVVIL